MRLVGMVMLGLALLAADGAALAQAPGARGQPTELSAPARRRAPTRIQVYPARQYVRECVDWLAVEHRPSGTMITPQMRCRWAVR